MKITRLFSLLALPLALAACDNAVVPNPDERLVGDWGRQEASAPPGRMVETISFGADGGFVREVRSFGYNGKPITELAGVYRFEGKYRVRGERLEVRGLRETSWDSLIGGSPTVEHLGGGWADAGTVRITGDTLVRTYVTYPADAPVETTVVYQRFLED